VLNAVLTKTTEKVTTKTEQTTTAQLTTTAPVTTTQPETTTTTFEKTTTTSEPMTTAVTTTPTETTTLQLTTTLEEHTTTTIETTMNPASTVEATTAKEQPIQCCCRCCYDMTSSHVTSSCVVCGRQSLGDAAQCAAQQPPTPTPTPTRSTEPNFEPPAPLEGSRFAERLAFTEEFLAKEQFTEQLASMPLSEKIALGFTASEFIVECSYDGKRCYTDT